MNDIFKILITNDVLFSIEFTQDPSRELKIIYIATKRDTLILLFKGKNSF